MSQPRDQPSRVSAVHPPGRDPTESLAPVEQEDEAGWLGASDSEVLDPLSSSQAPLGTRDGRDRTQHPGEVLPGIRRQHEAGVGLQ